MTNPYLIEGPALISFSGGRTSAYMLWHILQAHGGTLPADVHVVFANTGKEREETLRFVYECGSRWGVYIRWLEWRSRPLGKAGRAVEHASRFEEVGFNSASRNGEPFRELIRRKKYLPNVTERFCTAELKIDTMKQFMLAINFTRWDNIIGLRADEIRRIAKSSARNDSGKERWTNRWPMLKAGISKGDVWRFWLAGNADPKNLTEKLPQGFDLGLYPYEGNCDGCFLKGRGILTYSERDRPGTLSWWAEAEAEAEASDLTSRDRARFIKDDSYAAMIDDVARQPLLLPIDPTALEFDAECGVSGTNTNIRCGARKR